MAAWEAAPLVTDQPTIPAWMAAPLADTTPAVGDGKSLPDVITSPDALSADLPQSQAPSPTTPAPSLTDLRDRLRQGDISLLKRMAPDPNAPFPERFLRSGAMLATHLGEQAIEWPMNALIAFTQDPTKGEGLTFNPATNTFGGTPEALTAVQAVAGIRGHDIQYGGPRNELMPPGAPPPSEAQAPVPQNPLMPAGPAFVPPGTPAPMLPRILDLLRADEQVAANRPAEIPPPGAPSVDEQGNVAPIQQPPNPIDQPGVPRVAPAAGQQPDLPPVKDGYVRLYHGGSDPASGGARWVTPNYAYARDYRPGQPVSYVDVPQDHPAVQAATDTTAVEGTGMAAPIASFNAPEDIARQLRPVGEPPPGSVGAMGTPAAMSGLSPHEVTINRSQAENTKLLEQQQPGVQDLNLYVDGSHPTVAQIEQTVNASREDKTLRNLNTEVSQEAREVADRNNTARQIHYADNAGSQFDVNAATKARDDQLEADIGAAFRRKGQADAQPIVDVGQSILNGPDGKIDPVVRVVKNVTDKLYDADGNLETDPAKLWGVRKQINFLLSKEAAIETPSNQAAARQLMQLRNAVDAAIEPAAPGFGDAIANYAAASRPIDAMELLQAREPKLYDSLNRMQYSKVQQMMREAVAARHPDAPLNPWQSLSDDQMSRLWALRDDLRRSASAEDLARASGSDTVPNAIDVAKQYSGVALSAVPVLGPMAYRAKAALAPILDAAAARRQRTRGMQMQYPDPAKYQLRNPLAPP